MHDLTSRNFRQCIQRYRIDHTRLLVERRLCVNIYVQPRIETTVIGASRAPDGPVTEIDPTFTSLRALYPDPSELLSLDIFGFADVLPVWGDIRVAGRDLFSLWTGDPALPGYNVGLVDFALGVSSMMDEAIKRGSTTFDPHEAGKVLDLRHEGDALIIRSVDTRETHQVAVADAWHAVHGLNGRVRAFLLSLDYQFMEHPDLGRWVRGEVPIIDVFH